MNFVDPMGFERIPARIKNMLRKYFPSLNLDEIDIIRGLPFWVSSDVSAITTGSRTIRLRENLYYQLFAEGECKKDSVRTVAHELTHSNQYRNRCMNWIRYLLENAASGGYEHNGYETEAYGYEKRVMDSLSISGEWSQYCE